MQKSSSSRKELEVLRARVAELEKENEAYKLAQASSNRNTQLYQQLTHNFPEGAVFIFDHQLRYILAEGSDLEKHGLSKELLEGRPLEQILEPTFYEELASYYKKALAGVKSVWEMNSQGLTYRAMAVPVKNKQGEIVAGLSVAYDITQQKRIEEELRQSQKRFHSFMSNSPAAAWITSQDGEVVYINQTYSQLFGLEEAQVVGKTLLEIFPASIAKNYQENNQQVLQTGQVLKTVEPFIRPDGLESYVLTYKFPLSDGSGNTTIGGMALDITEQKQVEEALRENEARYRAMFEMAPIGVIQLGAAGNILQANPACYKLLGYEEKSKELEGYHFQSLTYLEDREQDVELFRQLQLGQQEQFQLEKRYVCKDEGVIWCQLSVKAVRSLEGKLLYYIAMLEDVTERKQNEVLLRQHNTYMRTLNETALGLINRLEPNSLLEAVISQAKELVKADFGFVYLLDRDSDSSSTTMSRTLTLGELDKPGVVIHQPGEGLVGQVWQTGQVMVIADYASWPQRTSDPEYDQAHATIGLPLKSEGQVVGVLGLSHRDERRSFSDNEIDLLNRFAQLASIALDNARLYSSAQRQTAQLMIAQQVARTINSTLQLEDIFQKVVQQIRTAFGYQMVSIYLGKEDKLLLQAALGYDGVISTIHLNQGVSGRVASSGQPAFVRDASQEKDFLYAVAGIRQAIIVPLKTGQGRVLGTLAVETTGQPKLRQDDLALLTLLADQISVAIENASLFVRLSQSEEKYRAVVNNVKEIIFQADREGRWTFLNPAWEEIMGYRMEESLGQSNLDYIHPEDRQYKSELFESVIRGEKEQFRYELRYLAKDGTIRWLQASGRIILNEQGEVSGVGGALLDTTERKQAEENRLRLERKVQETQRLESLGVLAGGLAHDFNNLLSAILGNISLAQLGLQPDQSEVSASLFDAEKACLRAREITRQLLTFASGGAPVKKTASLSELIEDSARFMVRGSKVQIEFKLPPDLWKAEVDSGQFSQVIQNLVLNAVQAMPGGGKIWLDATNLELFEGQVPPLAAGQYVRIRVEDQGSGIAAENLPKIFDPFFSTKAQGSGLGLAMAYSIIKRHGGQLEVESQEGKGTSFKLFLPAHPSGELEPVLAKSSELNSSAGRGRVLVMDDQEVIRQLLYKILVRLGYEVELAREGQEALERYKQAKKAKRPFALVIVDLTVPGGMGGEELLGHLLAVDDQAKVVVSSGYNDHPVVANYQKYGFKGVINKPYQLKELEQLLAEVLKEASGSSSGG